ncbi:MAG TPA: c-type cytochrome biogenesis protein CcmI [Gemmatimonadaceae bacterium]|nr:c-type cytochrome biogenesis protein CcmI [Gemmatimonadaceae bacterium]
MSAAIVALVVGTLLAIGALAFVLYPLFFEPQQTQAAAAIRARGVHDDVAIAALREIEFDRATGKLSEADYAQLKEQYTRQALAAMRASSASDASDNDADDVEAAIRAYRVARPTCATHGPRPEQNAIFCSECGRYLAGSCEQCGRRVEEVGARFCAACGHRLAA